MDDPPRRLSPASRKAGPKEPRASAGREEPASGRLVASERHHERLADSTLTIYTDPVEESHDATSSLEVSFIESLRAADRNTGRPAPAQQEGQLWFVFRASSYHLSFHYSVY